MASTSQIHVRSISLPSRLLPTDIEVGLQKLRSFQVNSSGNIQSGFLGLAELYNSVEELTHLTKPDVEESLSCSVELLDSCSAVRELFQMIKENVQTLQSALRRKGFEASAIQDDMKTYFCCRKKTVKFAAKTLKNLKSLERRMDPDHVSGNVLREITQVSIEILKGVLVFLFSPVAGTSTLGWSLVSKLMMNAKSSGSNTQNSVVNEVEDVDFALGSLQGKTRNEGVKVVDVQKRLQNLEAVVRGCEGGLEVLFRRLVRSRVTLLNVITDH